ncbi:MAG: hypothetical protein RR420_01375 [Anaerovoracaceae bacterium]
MAITEKDILRLKEKAQASRDNAIQAKAAKAEIEATMKELEAEMKALGANPDNIEDKIENLKEDIETLYNESIEKAKNWD